MSRHELELGILVLLGVGLVLYVVLGGADFGGGIWDLLAAGPTREGQRLLVQEALGPVWEANHVWLIFVLTGLLAAFPRAFAFLGIALYLPFGVAIGGIVFRGAAFAFRSHGDPSTPWVRVWARTFGVASLVSPFVLGLAAAAVASGDLRGGRGSPLVQPAWTSPFAVVLGALVVVMCAFLAATYLAVEAVQQAQPRLEEIFRRRAIVCGGLAGAMSLAALLLTRSDAPAIWHGMLRHGWPLVVVSGLGGGLALAMLLVRSYGAARAAAVVAVAAVVAGWGISQSPQLIVGQLTVDEAAGPTASLRAIFIGYLIGAALVAPSLALLLRVFKSERAQVRASPLPR